MWQCRSANECETHSSKSNRCLLVQRTGSRKIKECRLLLCNRTLRSRRRPSLTPRLPSWTAPQHLSPESFVPFCSKPQVSRHAVRFIGTEANEGNEESQKGLTRTVKLRELGPTVFAANLRSTTDWSRRLFGLTSTSIWYRRG